MRSRTDRRKADPPREERVADAEEENAENGGDVGCLRLGRAEAEPGGRDGDAAPADRSQDADERDEEQRCTDPGRDGDQEPARAVSAGEAEDRGRPER